VHYEDYATRVLGAGKTRAGVWKDFRCFNHDDSSASCSVNCQTGGINCKACGYDGHVHPHAKEFNLETPPDSPEWLAKQEGRGGRAPASAKRDEGKRDERPPAKKPKKPKKEAGPVVATYVYEDADGQPYLRVQKTENKFFYQSRWTGTDWFKGLTLPSGQSQPHVLYRLPQLLESTDPLVVFCEGEKDAERARSMGFTATSSAQGAGSAKITPATSWEALRGKDVAIFEDNDDQGRKHSKEVSELLFGVAKSVRIVRLPNLPDHGDLSDWADAGGTIDQLRALIAAVTPCRGPKPKLVVNGRDPEDIDNELLDHLAADGGFYSRGDKVVCLGNNETGARIAVQNHETMAFKIPKVIKLVSQRAGKDEDSLPSETPVRPTKHLTGAALVGGSERFPRLFKVVDVPFFDKDGRLIQAPGYDAKSCTYYEPFSPDLKVNPSPTRAEVDQALEFLKQELLREFAFAGETDRCHAFCALFQPFMVEVVNAKCPAYLFRANQPDSGKTFLAQCIGQIAFGRVPEVSEEEASVKAKGTEMRKLLDTHLMDGAQGILIDNIESDLNYPWLFQYLTSPVLEPRILGRSEKAKIPNRILWMITANNPALRADAVRRTVPIRFDLGDVESYEREFERDDLGEWIADHRKDLIEACLTIVAGWVAAGRPRSKTVSLNSYNEWSSTMCGLMEYLGIPGFLATTKSHRAEVDEAARLRREIVEEIVLRHGYVRNVDTQFLFRAIETAELVPPQVDLNGAEKRQIQQFAKYLKRIADLTPRVGSYRLLRSRSSATNSNAWTIEKIEQTTLNSPEVPDDDDPPNLRRFIRSGPAGERVSLLGPEVRSNSADSGATSGEPPANLRESKNVANTSSIYTPPEVPEVITTIYESVVNIDKEALEKREKRVYGVGIANNLRTSGTSGTENRTLSPGTPLQIPDWVPGRIAELERLIETNKVLKRDSSGALAKLAALRKEHGLVTPLASSTPPSPPASGPVAAQAPPVASPQPPRRSRLDDDDDLGAALEDFF
jgi:hypothetical protein